MPNVLSPRDLSPDLKTWTKLYYCTFKSEFIANFRVSVNFGKLKNN